MLILYSIADLYCDMSFPLKKPARAQCVGNNTIDLPVTFSFALSICCVVWFQFPALIQSEKHKDWSNNGIKLQGNGSMALGLETPLSWLICHFGSDGGIYGLIALKYCADIFGSQRMNHCEFALDKGWSVAEQVTRKEKWTHLCFHMTGFYVLFFLIVYSNNTNMQKWMCTNVILIKAK